MLPTIKAARVALRWLTEADVDSLFEIFSDADVIRYWGTPAMENRADAEKSLRYIHEHFSSGDLFKWGVALNETDEIIGTCTLNHIDRSNRRAEIGYALNRKFWGGGLMLEATTALVRNAFGAMNLHRLEADVDPRNAASIRLLEKLGFQREGFLRERWLVRDEICDTVFYGLLKREFAFENVPI